jgi:hypothetical protein
MPSEQFDVDEIEKLLSKPQRALLQLILAAETSPEQVDSPPALP